MDRGYRCSSKRTLLICGTDIKGSQWGAVTADVGDNICSLNLRSVDREQVHLYTCVARPKALQNLDTTYRIWIKSTEIISATT